MKKADGHLAKYLYEAAGLGFFMFSAGLFDTLIDHPNLYFRQHISSALARRLLIGLSMGLTALYIFTSAWGKKSGAYINPAVTIARYRLGQISGIDSIFYVLFQFAGGTFGMYVVYLIIPNLLSHPSINYIVTQPGEQGEACAFIAEVIFSFLLIIAVLLTEKHKTLSQYTAYIVAALITLFITFEAPLSGMSMNPARTLASAVVGGQWYGFWIYCLAPLGGMVAGAEVVKRNQKNSQPVNSIV